jgi:uncharacterized protein DUF6364
MAKLTLNVDESVVTRAKRYAARRGISVSRLVEQFLALVSRAGSKGDDDLPPILARLRFELKGVSVSSASYRRLLERKYR